MILALALINRQPLGWYVDRVAYRLERLEKPPTLSQRQFERLMTSHLIEKDRMVKEGALLVFGDSHLYFLPTEVLEFAYNFAIGGESAARLANRIASYKSLEKARGVVLGGGANDLFEGGSIEEVRLAWTKMLAVIPRRVRLICVGVPVNMNAGSEALERILEVNHLIQTQCLEKGGAMIQVTPGVSLWAGTGFREDGRHLNGRSYEVLTSLIRANLDLQVPLSQ